MVYLVPNQELRGYAVIWGELTCATAISAQLGENDIQFQVDAGKIQGLVYLVPNQELRGYAVINGEIVCATAMSATIIHIKE